MNIKVILGASCHTNYPVSTSGVSTQISHFLLPSEPVKGLAQLLLPCLEPILANRAGQWGSLPGPKEHSAGMLRADITFVASWITSLPPASKLGYFYCPKTPHSQQSKVRCRQCSAYETLQANSKKVERERKMDLSPQMAWLAVGRREGGSFCSGFVPISKNSPTLSHSHLNETTLKSVMGLAREKEKLCDIIWHGGKSHVRSTRLLMGTGIGAYGKIQLLEWFIRKNNFKGCFKFSTLMPFCSLSKAASWL